jgi:predicted transcriptional regulator
MSKRGKLEIIRDILAILQQTNKIRLTPLLRKSNLSSKRFYTYYKELIQKDLIQETTSKNTKFISLTEKGFKFLEKYQTIVNFIDEFEL